MAKGWHTLGRTFEGEVVNVLFNKRPLFGFCKPDIRNPLSNSFPLTKIEAILPIMVTETTGKVVTKRAPNVICPKCSR